MTKHIKIYRIQNILSQNNISNDKTYQNAPNQKFLKVPVLNRFSVMSIENGKKLRNAIFFRNTTERVPLEGSAWIELYSDES